jgi:hypothetical protein
MQEEIRIRKFLALEDLHQPTAMPKAIHGSEKFFLILSEHVFTESVKLVHKRGLNLAVTNGVSNLDIACMAEIVRSKLPSLPHPLCMEFCWRILHMSKKSRPLTSNITRKESMALKYRKDNKVCR